MPAAPGVVARKWRMRSLAAGVMLMLMAGTDGTKWGSERRGPGEAYIMMQVCPRRCDAAGHPGPVLQRLHVPDAAPQQEFQSMTVVSVKQALSGKLEAGSKATVRGWVRTRRDSKAGLSFVYITDGSCFAPIQAVVPATLANYETEVKHLTAGAGLIASGTLVPSQGQGQSFELQADRIEVTGFVDDPETYPIQPKQHSMEFLREVAHLRPRTNLFGAVTRVRHTMMTAIHRHLTEQGFFWINTPIITTSDAEGAGDMFRLSTLDLANLPRTPDGKIDFRKDFFGREAFLTVSGQLNVEAYAPEEILAEVDL